MTGAEAKKSGTRRTPVHLWIVGIVALLWNAMGVFDYLATQLQLESYMSEFTEEQLEYFYGFPAWAVSGWAVAVWTALVGAVGLVLRKKWSLYAFVVSLAGMIVSSIYTIGLTDGFEIMGPASIYMTAAIWIISIFLVVYTCRMVKNEVLN